MVSGMNEFIERMEREIKELYALKARQGIGSSEWCRLVGKIEGMELALSYYLETQ